MGRLAVNVSAAVAAAKPSCRPNAAVMPMAACRAKEFTADFTKSPFQPPAIVGRVFAHGSGSEHKFIAEGNGDGASGFEQCFEMGLGGLLEAARGFAPVAPVCVVARQERGFGNPHTVLIPAELYLRDRNDHGVVRITRCASGVKRSFHA